MRSLKTELQLCMSSADAPVATFTPCPNNCVLRKFTCVTADEVTTTVRALPNKQCASDLLPLHLLRENVASLAPFMVELFNHSLADGVVPENFKSAYITRFSKSWTSSPQTQICIEPSPTCQLYQNFSSASWSGN
jgi:hypothetical protein